MLMFLEDVSCQCSLFFSCGVVMFYWKQLENKQGLKHIVFAHKAPTNITQTISTTHTLYTKPICIPYIDQH